MPPIPFAKTPVPRPVPNLYEEPAENAPTQSAKEAGYDDTSKDAERTSLKQDVFVKLFFATYFDVTPEHIAVAIGIKMHAYYYHSFVNQAIGTDIVDAAAQSEFKVKKARLSKLWWALRRQTFGKTSYLSTHIVELHDFQATVFNLAWDLIRLMNQRSKRPLGSWIKRYTSKLRPSILLV
jgi:hypothetical protein